MTCLCGSNWLIVPHVFTPPENSQCADAHRDDGKRFVVPADEKLAAFVELQSAVRAAKGRQ